MSKQASGTSKRVIPSATLTDELDQTTDATPVLVPRTNRHGQGPGETPGAPVNRYETMRKLDHGGMGVVYVARHRSLGSEVALKVLRSEVSDDPSMLQRFFTEARAAASIEHPGIIKVHDVGYQNDTGAYIAMELLDGESLRRRLAREGRLSVRQALRFAGQIANALSAAHERHIVHRDLKPDNIFLVLDTEVTGGERIKLLDFGIARIIGQMDGVASETGKVVGTPRYMAPEQCCGDDESDHRVDLYALGCILFAMLCGRPPFGSRDEEQLSILHAHVHDTPPVPSSLRPGLSARVDALVLYLLAKRPDDRYRSASDVGDALSALCGEPSRHDSQSSLDRPSTGRTEALNPRGVPLTQSRLYDELSTNRSGATGRSRAREESDEHDRRSPPAPDHAGSHRLWWGAVGVLLVMTMLMTGMVLVRQPSSIMRGPSYPPPAAPSDQAPSDPERSSNRAPEPRPYQIVEILRRLKRVARPPEGARPGDGPLPVEQSSNEQSISGLLGQLFGRWFTGQETVTWWIWAPRGAELLIDGDVQQRGLVVLQRTPGGVQNVVIRKEGYHDKGIRVSLERGGVMAPRLEPLEPPEPPEPDNVQITILVPETESAIVQDASGKLLGPTDTPFELRRDQASVALTVKSAGCEKTVQVTPNRTQRIPLTLDCEPERVRASTDKPICGLSASPRCPGQRTLGGPLPPKKRGNTP